MKWFIYDEQMEERNKTKANREIIYNIDSEVKRLDK